MLDYSLVYQPNNFKILHKAQGEEANVHNGGVKMKLSFKLASRENRKTTLTSEKSNNPHWHRFIPNILDKYFCLRKENRQRRGRRGKETKYSESWSEKSWLFLAPQEHQLLRILLPAPTAVSSYNRDDTRLPVVSFKIKDPNINLNMITKILFYIYVRIIKYGLHMFL